MRAPEEIALAAAAQPEGFAEAARAAPRISICIPTYNRASFIGRAIDQALAQTGADIEVVVVDDASTDATLDVVARCADPRLRVERAERHLGLGEIFNRCFDLARGVYVKAFCDDDFLYPGAISTLADALERFPAATFATSAWNHVDAAGTTTKTMRLLLTAPERGQLVELREIVQKSWLFRNQIGSPSSVLLRKSALSGIRFNPDYKQMMDWDVWLRLLRRGPLVYVPAVLSGYQWHAETLSAKQAPLAQTASDLLKVSRDLTASLSDWRGEISRFEVKRLQFFCLMSSLLIVLQNISRRRWRFVAGNIGLAFRALGTLVADW